MISLCERQATLTICSILLLASSFWFDALSASKLDELILTTMKDDGKNNTTVQNRTQLEDALKIPGQRCGQVPMLRRYYKRSFNGSTDLSRDADKQDDGKFRILHGLDSSLGEWPWIARIAHDVGDDSQYCTGTLLNKRWIITAGHCAPPNLPLDRYKVTLGLYDLLEPESSSVSVGVEKIIVHPDYHDMNNDISLFKLKESVNLTEQVQPACLVRATRDVFKWASDKRCFNVGYGLTEGMNEATRLQKLQIRAKKPNECNSDQLNSIQLKRNTLCIGPPEGQIGASCKGDSGGPDLCYDPKLDQWFIFATVSYGPPVCDREKDDHWLTVSVDLSNYRTWIMRTILENSP